MKISKQIKILHGITAVRVKLGLTQLAFAQCLGISKSLVSMIENGRRSLPPSALIKLAALEGSLQPVAATENISFRDERMPAESPERASIRLGREEKNRLQLQELQYRQRRMTNEYNGITQILQHLQCLLQPSKNIDAPLRGLLELQYKKLCGKLKRCDEQAQAGLEGRIQLLERVNGASKSMVNKSMVSGSLVDRSLVNRSLVNESMVSGSLVNEGVANECMPVLQTASTESLRLYSSPASLLLPFVVTRPHRC